MNKSEPPPATKVISKNIELFTFDRKSKLEYQGFCKISIRKATQLFEISSEELDVVVPFQWQFIPNNNVLLILAPKLANDVALYFTKNETCQKLFDTIIKLKTDSKDPLNGKNLNPNIFNERFLSPLLDEVCCPNANPRIKAILKEVTLSPNASQPSFPGVNKKEKELCTVVNLSNWKVEPESAISQEFNETKIVEIKYPWASNNTVNFDQINLSKDETEITNFVKNNDQKQAQLREKLPINEFDNDFGDNEELDFNSLREIPTNPDGDDTDYKISDDEENEAPPSKKRRIDNSKEKCGSVKSLFSKNEKTKGVNVEEITNIISSDSFEIRSMFKNGIEKHSLIIPHGNKKNLCHCFKYNPMHKRFCCYNCQIHHKKYVSATLLKNDSDEYYIEIHGRHLCKPVFSTSQLKNKNLLEIQRYESLVNENPKYPPIKKSNFKLSENRNGIPDYHLEVTFPDGKKFKYFRAKKSLYYCYKCQQNGQNTGARLQRNDNEEPYVLLSNTDHICNSIENEIIPEVQIIKAPNFKLYENRNGVIDSKLQITLFDGSKYNYHRINNTIYVCSQCQNKHGIYVNAKLHQNENGVVYFVLGKNEHLCNPKNEQIEFTLNISHLPIERIIKTPNYKLLQSRNGTVDSKMEVTLMDGKKYNYNRMSKNIYVCSKCYNKSGLYVSAKLCLKENKEECYVILGKSEHVCEQIQNDEDELIPDARIIKVPNFKLFKNRNGFPDSKLQITLCAGRRYNYNRMNNTIYVCGQCRNKHGIYVNAKLHHNENGEVYFVLGKNEHVCKPLANDFTEEPNDRIILTSNFKFGECVNGITTLEIIQSNRKYLYRNLNRNSTFYCVKCKINGKNLNAKLRYNDKQESYLILNSDEHVCKPIFI